MYVVISQVEQTLFLKIVAIVLSSPLIAHASSICRSAARELTPAMSNFLSGGPARKRPSKYYAHQGRTQLHPTEIPLSLFRFGSQWLLARAVLGHPTQGHLAYPEARAWIDLPVSVSAQFAILSPLVPAASHETILGVGHYLISDSLVSLLAGV